MLMRKNDFSVNKTMESNTYHPCLFIYKVFLGYALLSQLTFTSTDLTVSICSVKWSLVEKLEPSIQLKFNWNSINDGERTDLL